MAILLQIWLAIFVFRVVALVGSLHLTFIVLQINIAAF